MKLVFTLRCILSVFFISTHYCSTHLTNIRMVLIRCIIMLCLLLSAVAAGRRAIVTLLSGAKSNAERYTRLLHFWVYSLRNAGYSGEIVVMYAKDFPVNVPKLTQLLNIIMVPVTKLSVPETKRNSHYSSMLTKLHLWDLTEYSQVMYYDCDFIFQRNPADAFDSCVWSPLCATVDTGTNSAVCLNSFLCITFLCCCTHFIHSSESSIIFCENILFFSPFLPLFAHKALIVRSFSFATIALTHYTVT